MSLIFLSKAIVSPTDKFNETRLQCIPAPEFSTLSITDPSVYTCDHSSSGYREWMVSDVIGFNILKLASLLFKVFVTSSDPDPDPDPVLDQQIQWVIWK